jgi:hypothetical protein
MLGGGHDSLIGIVHRIAACMGEDYELVGGVFSADPEASSKFARALGLDPRRAYPGLDALTSGETSRPAALRMSLVTIATPNYLHYEMATKLVAAGFHVVCEKPVTTTAAQAQQLQTLLASRQQVFAIAHTYTGYAMVRQMRAMVAAGAIGPVQKVDAQYYQGWINPIVRDKEERRAAWRLDPHQGGQSCCIGDIGVHAFNLIEYTTGLRVDRVLADLDTADPDNELDVDGSVLLRFTNGTKGVLCSSQIATGEENNLRLAVYGRTGGLKWAQEEPQRLEFLQENQPLAVIKPGYSFNAPAAREATRLPPGHPEGFFEAMGNLYTGVANAIRGGAVDAGAFPGIADGVRSMRFLEAVLGSARNDGIWTAI